MKKNAFRRVLLLFLAGGLLATFTLAQPTGHSVRQVATDTLPENPKKKLDLDRAIAEMDRSELEKAPIAFDGAKLERQLHEAMKSLEENKAKMSKELTAALQQQDWQELAVKTQKAMEAVQIEKMAKETAAAQAASSAEIMKAEWKKLQETEFTKLKKELRNGPSGVEKALQQAQATLQKAQKDLAAYDGLVDALDSDALLNKTEAYTVEYNHGQLTVNGKKLTAEAAEKYRPYLREKSHFLLKKNKEGRTIEKP